MKEKVITAAKKRILFLPHAIRQISRPDRMISTDEVRDAIFHGEVIEEYPQDQRGESCLLLHVKLHRALHVKLHRALHVVCAPKEEYLAVITAYLPSPEQWSEDFKVRRT